MNTDQDKKKPVTTPRPRQHVNNNSRADTWTPVPGALYDGAGNIAAMLPGAPDPWAGWGDRR